ncbi:DUF927 domain-containing protein [Runella rosea]|uniref:DUF927 domain-containing protein n=2 Tax=Runella rosea TaxID=2259595 RepID=A0A344TDH8_9BACT|nr:DUF927 domain-containing protein [Runella rosea]
MPYQFEKHPKKKGRCPSCGDPKSFRYYEKDGVRLSEEFGKCERTNSCGHHSKPNSPSISTTILSVNVSTGSENATLLPDVYKQEQFKTWNENQESAFHVYCQSLGITKKHLSKHSVGTDQKGRTVFILKNEKKEIVNAKWILYKSDGHRDKSFNSHSLKQPPDGKKYGMCLYGEDLLDPDKQRTVIVVESEKTKVIASFSYPQFDWVACGSANGLTDAKITPLKGRKVIWLCDADKAGRQDASSIKNLEKHGIDFEVIDLFPERNDGYDIADAIGDKQLPDIHYGVRMVNLGVHLDSPKQKKDSYALNRSQYSTVDYRKDGSIWVLGKKNWENVANFHLFIKYCTEDENQLITWVLELRPKNGDTVFLEVEHDDFCSSKRMKNLITAKQLSFKANDDHLSEIHAHLFALKDFSKAVKINRFGLHPESELFLFANHAVTPLGQIISPDEFGIVSYQDWCISIPRTNTNKRHRFTLSAHPIKFNDWFNLFQGAHLKENAFLPACFYIMSLFRDIAVYQNGFSPILYAKGPAGTGKSSIIRSLTYLFGFKQDDINLKSKNTDAALIKLMSQSSNTCLWMDEFVNNLPQEGLLQAAYDNTGYHKTAESSRNKTETESIDIHSALMLTSNYLPQNPIFFSRCLFIPIESQQKTKEQIIAFTRLSELQENGLGMITVELLKHRALIKESYSAAYTTLYNRLKACFINERLPERLFANMALTMACAFVLACEGHIALCEYTDREDILDEFTEIGRKYISRQHSIQNDTSLLSEFFGTLQVMFDQHLIHEGIHFRFDGPLLYLRTPLIYTIFMEKYRRIYYKEAPDRDSIFQEILQMEAPRTEKEVIKTIRFRQPEKNENKAPTQAITNSLSITYEYVKSKYDLDLINRQPKNF